MKIAVGIAKKMLNRIVGVQEGDAMGA